jgi:hypothetical protein
VKQIRSAALSRHHAPPLFIVAGLEQLQLRKLPLLARCLFLELVGMSDFTTGRIVTSYAVLEALLDWDQAPCAHAADKPTHKRVRTALQQLLDLGLVRLDRVKNEKDKGLFLKVQKRQGLSASEGMNGRLSGRPEIQKKPRATRTCETREGDEGQTEGQGVQNGSLTPLTPLVVHSDGAAVGSIQAPPGGPNGSPPEGGHAPRRAPTQPSITVREMRSRLKQQPAAAK